MSNQYSRKYTEEDYINKCKELELIYIYLIIKKRKKEQ